jgi:tripartite-type tricarboxylate transporter receptor subunit TctC
MNLLHVGLLVVALHATASTCFAQASYPSQPVRIVVPYGAGGTPDFHARLFAEHLSKVLGQAVVVENKVGASGIIGAQAVSGAPKDGYTLLWAANSLFGINPFVFKNLPYTLEQFQPVSNVVQLCFAVVARPNLGVTSLKGLVDYMKANPEKLNYGNAGIGNQPHLIWEQFLSLTSTRATMVTFKSGPEIYTAMFGGFVDAYVAVISATDIAYIKAGKVNGLATTCSARVPHLPDTPTMSELGYRDLTVYGTYQLYVAAGVPAGVVTRLAKAAEAVKSDAAYVASVNAAMATPAVEKTPEDFAAWLQNDRQKWSTIATKAKIRVE